MIDPSARGAVRRFFDGVGYLGRGFRVGLGEPGLRPWMLAPAALSLAAAIAGGWTAWHFGGAWVSGWSSGHGAWLAAVLYLLLILFVVVATYVAYVGATRVAVSPFSGVLSQRAEALASGRAPPGGGLAEGPRGLFHAVLGAILYISVAAPLLFVQLVAPRR
jgi:uncharacterized protein involved in cysteine biosynthesis